MSKRVIVCFSLFLISLAMSTLTLGVAHVRAQDVLPTPTLVITQPTPATTPSPALDLLQTLGQEVDSPSSAESAAGLAMHDGAVTEGSAGYVVDAGDTLLSVALELGMDVDEMGCVIRPDFDPAQPLVIGDRLLPLSAETLCHRAGEGETVRDIATLYGVNALTILGERWNNLEDEYTVLPEGRFVRVPYVTTGAMSNDSVDIVQDESPFLTLMLAQPTTITPQEVLGQESVQTVIRRAPVTAPVPADWKYGSGVFLWPTYGWLTQGYRADHRAIDIAATQGSPVTASDRGVVLRAGWNNQGYGNFVIIDHNIDYLTLYAHLDHIFVQEGEIVAQGQILGTVGSTGNSTGPHLHFEIRDFGRLANPLEFLGR